MAVTKKAMMTATGLIGAAIMIVGGLGSCVAFGLIPGVIVAGLGILVSFAGNKNRDVLKCTQCGFTRAF